MDSNEMNTNEANTKQMGQTPKKGFKYYLNQALGWLFLFIITYIFIVLGQILGSVLIQLTGSIFDGAGSTISQSDLWITASLYAMFIGMWIVGLILLNVRKKNRPILDMLWTKMPGNTWKKFLIGAAIGGGANAFCILIAWLHKDIMLYYDSFRPISLLIILVTVLIQSSAEELWTRVYLYRKLMSLYKGNFGLSLVLNSLLFALLHLGNEGVTVLSIINIFLSGVMFTLMVYYMDSVWAAFAGHMAWNYTQNIIFGLPNSGNVVPFSIFKLDASTAMDSFAYNVGFGIEGTVVADIVLLLCCVGLFVWGRRHKGSKKATA